MKAVRARERSSRPVPTTITVKDVVRGRVYQLPASQPMMRVPYDLFDPVGPVLLKNGMIHYLQSDEIRTGRAGNANLADARTDERVLVRLLEAESVSEHGDQEWWLCQVLAIDGIDPDD